jgi:4'-phosphopantetheinyl transferase
MEVMETVRVDCGFFTDLTWDDHPGTGLPALQLHRVFIKDHLLNLEQYRRLLSVDEISRAERYHHLRDHYRFVISRAVLRLLLARKISVHASALVFGTDTNKKPFLAEPTFSAVEFNISHAGEYILIAVSDSPIGTDLEFMDPNFNYPEVAKFAFNEDEMSFISNASAPLFAFYMLWSRKEALLKATGKGISDDLPAVACLDGTNLVLASAIGSKANWKIHSFIVAADYIGNLACSSGSTIFFSNVKSDQILKN